MDHLRMDGRNTLGKFLLPLLGIWKINDHFYIDPPYQVIKSDAYRRKCSHTMKYGIIADTPSFNVFIY